MSQGPTRPYMHFKSGGKAQGLGVGHVRPLSIPAGRDGIILGCWPVCGVMAAVGEPLAQSKAGATPRASAPRAGRGRGLRGGGAGGPGVLKGSAPSSASDKATTGGANGPCPAAARTRLWGDSAALRPQGTFWKLEVECGGRASRREPGVSGHRSSHQTSLLPLMTAPTRMNPAASTPGPQEPPPRLRDCS